MEREIPEHIPEERLEAYALGTLSPEVTQSIEEHLLFCTTCQDELEAIDGYIRAMRGAAKRIMEEQAGARFLPGFWDRVPAWVRGPAPVWTGAAAMIAILLLVGLHVGERPGVPVEVELQAVRGASIGTAPSGHALHLRLDGRGVPDNPSWRIEIVDEDGARVWAGTGSLKPEPAGNQSTILADVNQSFKPGTYFVRLLNQGLEPAREYQLTIQKADP